MARKPPDKWPARPKGFYDDWTIFCSQALSARLQHGDDAGELAAVLLAAGAILGGARLLVLVAENKDALDAQGRKWGIDNLSAIAGVGGAVLGATVGGLGVAWLVRTLGRHADAKKVDELQVRLSGIRREFEALSHERAQGQLTTQHHRLAVERLFHEFSAA
jgi:hypothetical protein